MKVFIIFNFISQIFLLSPSQHLLVQQSGTVLVAEVYTVTLVSPSTKTPMFSLPLFLKKKVMKAVSSPFYISKNNSILE